MRSSRRLVITAEHDRTTPSSSAGPREVPISVHPFGATTGSAALEPLLYETILNTMTEGVVVTNHLDRILFVNNQLARMIERPLRRLVGREVSILFPDEVIAQLWVQTAETSVRGQTTRVETTLRGARGPVAVQLIRSILDPNPSDASRPASVCLVTDLSALKARQADILAQNYRLLKMAVTDELTGLVNRRRFNALLANAWSRWCRLGEPLTCIMLDVDHFKNVNDQYGHPTGDEVLRMLARAVQSSVGHAGVAARYGGEEFAILMSNTDGRSAYLWAEQIREKISGLRLGIGQETLGVTVSLGVAASSSKLTGPGELVCRADLALYDAKRRGRNRVSLWNMPSVAELVEEAGRGHAQGQPDNAGRAGEDWLDDIMASRTAMAMARAIAEKDHSTGSHCMWVGWLAAEIGRRMGMDEQQTEQLHIAGVLHDLGKIGIPGAILLKPGPLTEAERDLVDCHAQIGSELVARHRASRRIQHAIRYHHDWYDGSRGISGLRGSKLPRDARILAVADSFQSMIEDRPYRDRLTPLQAMTELRRCSGSQFDPAIVDILAEIMNLRSAVTLEPTIESALPAAECGRATPATVLV
jgi:diguanylate cyclase (GGDEF)-like protein